MKRKHKLSIMSAMIVITMLCSFLVLPVNATTEVKSAALEKIDTALSKRLEAMNDTEAISVSVWFKDIDRSELKERVESEIKNNLSSGLSASQKAVDLVFLDESETKSVDELSNLIEAYSDVTTEDVQAVITLKRDISAQMHQQNNMSIIERVLPGISTAIASKANTEYADGASIQYVCKYAPNADMYLTKSQIYDLANNSDIVEINYRSTNMIDLGTNETSLLNTDKLRSSTDYDLRFLGVLGLDHARDVWGLSGNGMHIGIVESTNTVNFNLFTNGKVDNIDDWNPNGDSHGTQIASLMLGEKRTGNVVEYPGAIPNAVVHVTKTYGSVANLKGAVERLIGVGNLNVISSSVGAFVNGENGAYYSDEAKWYDYVSTHYNIHLALCAGNYYPNLGPFEVVHSNNSYNAVVVGNCDINGALYTGDSEMFEASLYSQGNTESYKPDIVSVGVDVQFPVPDEYDNMPSQDTGTSFSTPLVACAMVQLSQKSSVLYSSPVLMKALLLSSSKITAYMTSQPMISSVGGTAISLSHSYGAGMLNVINAYKSFVDSANYKKGTFSEYSSGVTYTKNVTKSVGKTIRVCATWDRVISYTGFYGGSYTIDDEELDTMRLTVTTPSGRVYRSSYLYDNKQMISFVSTENGIYTFQLDRIGNGNSENTIDYAIAFSVQ